MAYEGGKFPHPHYRMKLRGGSPNTRSKAKARVNISSSSTLCCLHRGYGDGSVREIIRVTNAEGKRIGF